MHKFLLPGIPTRLPLFRKKTGEFDLLCAAYDTARILFPGLAVDEAVMVCREHRLIDYTAAFREGLHLDARTLAPGQEPLLQAAAAQVYPDIPIHVRTAPAR